MYLSTIDRTRVGTVKGVSANVVALGAVSLITDVSSEMVAAVLPIYLVVGLQLSPALYGVVDGLYAGATTVLRLVGGYLADRTTRRKAVAAFGYGLSAVAKVGLLFAGTSTALLGAAITVDRAGKGLRTAPRDALITLSTPAGDLGRAFGVHRAMDGVGAFLGPLVALAVLAAGDSFDSVFVTSSCIAALGVVVLVLFVRDHRTPMPVRPVRLATALGLLRRGRVRRLVLVAAVLGFVTIGDGFVYLLLRERVGLSIGWFPALAVGTSLVYLALAAPMGVLADRVGRLRVVIAGHLALAAVYAGLFGPWGGRPLVVVVVLLHGVFYAATDGVLMALAGPVIPRALRTSGLALVQTGQALGYLGSSVLFGLAWHHWGAEVSTRLAAVAVAVGVVVVAVLSGHRR